MTSRSVQLFWQSSRHSPYTLQWNGPPLPLKIAPSHGVAWLEFNVPFQHKYGYITDDFRMGDLDPSQMQASWDKPESTTQNVDRFSRFGRAYDRD